MGATRWNRPKPANILMHRRMVAFVQFRLELFIDGFGGLAHTLHHETRARFITRNHIEQFLIDGLLPEPMKGSVELFRVFLDILLGALHDGGLRFHLQAIRRRHGTGKRMDIRGPTSEA